MTGRNYQSGGKLSGTCDSINPALNDNNRLPESWSLLWLIFEHLFNFLTLRSEMIFSETNCHVAFKLLN